MKIPTINTQGVLAILTVLGCFTLLGVYVLRGQVPDVVLVAIISGALMLVLGFYFGHSNGTTSALAVAATALANRTNPGAVVSAPADPITQVQPPAPV